MSGTPLATRKIFVGIKIPEVTANSLSAFGRSSLVKDGGLRWLDPDDLHITLEFIGETPAMRVPSLMMKLRGVGGPQFEVHISGADIFRDAGVLVVDIEQSDGLISLQTSIVQVLSGESSLADRRPYRPHITVGRWSPSAPIAETHLESLKRQLSQSCKESGIHSFPVEEFVLYETVSGHYRILEKFSLHR